MGKVDQQILPFYTHPCAMSNEEEFNLAESIKIFLPLTKEVRVLVVDGDAACLTLVSKMLLIFGYKVLTATTAADAFSIIKEKEDELKLILAEVHLPDMNRYEFIEKVTQVSKLPLVIMSDDDDDISMLGGLFKGATFYLVKPVTLNNMKNLWQFAYMNNKDLLQFSDSGEENNNNIVQIESQGENAAADDEVSKDKRKREEEISDNKDEEINEDNDDSKAPKKAKLVWSDELHTKFLQAVNALGIEDAHPKTILQHMNVPGLAKENISGHLQKYRISLKREQDAIMLKSMSRDCFDEPGFASFSCSSSSRIFNLQEGTFVQFPNHYFSSTTTSSKPQFGVPFQKNLITTTTTHISMPNSFEYSAYYNHHPNPDYDLLYLMSTGTRNETLFAMTCKQISSNPTGMGITNNSMELAGGIGIGEFWESNFIKKEEEEDIFNGKMSFSNVLVSDFGNAKDIPTLLDDSEQQVEQVEQIPVLSTTTTTTPPAQSEKQEKIDIFGEKSGETELFDFTKQSTVVFRDEDLDDFW
ncbi:two-component response regulator ARR2 isoform X1 [Ziziphus jujuba]|uniref:Two-component response regulator ARR2 isoform X1 n=1 Tax=Ziziphus jujuba TaxID=326968 RepID=A0ABM3ZWY5_ZIZJJ|nr:two-component response regulator ARR2 isoform X1 [Ziziphus jujuba]